LNDVLARIVWAAVPVLVGAAAVYVVLAAAAFVLADRVMFQPPPPGYRADAPGVLALHTADGARIAAVFLPNDAAEHAILYSHGNAEDLAHVLPRLRFLRELGFAVLGYDYRGYGASDGRPAAAAAVRDIDAAYEHLVRERGVPPERILLYGASIGSGPTLDLAAREPVAGVVLESAFTSAYRVMTHWAVLPFDRFPNIDRIRDVDRPVLVIHGTADRIIPFRHGQALYDAAPGPKRRLWVEAAGHNDVALVAGEAWGRAIRDFSAFVAAGAAD
jgi:abhydrolase domain-containing protein 17